MGEERYGDSHRYYIDDMGHHWFEQWLNCSAPNIQTNADLLDHSGQASVKFA